jgi:hypothetical protein
MKLLPKSKINEQVNAEKKANIDAGVFLARKIDALREEVLTLQKDRDIFISGSQQVINDSLSELFIKNDNLEKENRDLEWKRRELLKPLDDEWNTLDKDWTSKTIFLKDLQDIRKRDEQLTQKEKSTKENEEKISDILARTRREASDTEKAKANTLSLKEMAQRKYEIAETERLEQSKDHEMKMKELGEKIKTYENGITIYEGKEQDLLVKEAELITREKHLASQQASLRIAYEKIKNK